MKVLADINVSVAVVTLLRRSGVTVDRVSSSLGPRAADLDIVAAARQSGEVLLSHDQDFTAILALTGATKPSLLNLRTTSVDPEFLVRCIRRALEEAVKELDAGAVVTVEDGEIRVRRLPISGE